MQNNTVQRENPKFVTAKGVLLVAVLAALWGGAGFVFYEWMKPSYEDPKSFSEIAGNIISDIEKGGSGQNKKPSSVTIERIEFGDSKPKTTAPKQADSKRIAREFKREEDKIFNAFLKDQGSRNQYIPQMRTLITQYSASVPHDNLYMGDAYFHLGMMNYMQQNFGQGEAHFRHALKIYEKNYRDGHYYIGTTHANIGHCVFSQGRYREALEHYLRARTVMRKHRPNSPEIVSIDRMIQKTQELLGR